MDLAMASVGVRGVLVKAPAEGGAELAVSSDATRWLGGPCSLTTPRSSAPLPQGRHAVPEAKEPGLSRTQWFNIGGKSNPSMH